MQLQGLSAGNWTRDPASLDERSTDRATEAVAMSLGASSVYSVDNQSLNVICYKDGNRTNARVQLAYIWKKVPIYETKIYIWYFYWQRIKN